MVVHDPAIELRSTTWLFASFILIALLGVSSIGVAQVDTWERKADMPTARAGFGTTAVNGRIYAIGGFGPNRVGTLTNFSTVEAYDTMTDTWTRKADMPTARDLFSTIAAGGKIYVIGGVIEGTLEVLSTVEVYDPTTDSWETKADIPTRRFALATAVVGGKIYVIGGVDIPDGKAENDPLKDLSTVEVYDPRTDTWERRTDMPTARGFLANNAPVVSGKIHVIGGWQNGVRLFEEFGIATVEVYDPATDTWGQRADMPTPRGAFGISKVDGKIYVIGGGSSRSSELQTVEMYDPTTDTWESKADMPTLRNWLSASAVNGIIYAIGGWRSGHISIVEAYGTGVGLRVTVISPQEGSGTGGEPIAMSGTGFPPDVIVTIGGKPLIDMEIINGTVISGITPPGTAGEHDLVISSPSAPMSDLFYRTTFLYPSPVPPTITAINPNQGPLTGGQIATIVGTGFIPGVSVVISDIEATVTAITPTHITFTTPPHTEGAKFVLVRNVDRKVGFLDGGSTYVDVEFPPEDLNLDGVVNLFDLVLVASQFGQVEANLSGDVNGDGTVNIFDLVLVASHFGEEAVGAAPPGIDGVVTQAVSQRTRHALFRQNRRRFKRFSHSTRKVSNG